MLSYQAAYRMQMGAFFAEILDFPGVSAVGTTLSEARNNLYNALRYEAERLLRRGELLPIPTACQQPADAYLVETVTLVPTGTDQVMVRMG
jgi:predicted RNase H-like HicB family nuclease